MNRARISFAVAAVLVSTFAPAAKAEETSVVMSAMQDELARAATMQLNGMAKPYYVAVRAADNDYLRIVASMGKIVEDSAHRSRRMDSSVRVGDHTNDNSNLENDSYRYREDARQTSLDERYDDIRHDAWLSIDASYKIALDDLAKKAAIRAGEQPDPDRGDDFSHETPTVLVDMKAPPTIEHARTIQLARALSGIGVAFPALGASANIVLDGTRRYFVSNEGARVVEPQLGAMVSAFFTARADDGMQVSTFRAVATCSADLFPAEESFVAEAKKAATELDEIRRSPVIEDYSGPILFEGVAAAQLVYQELAYSLSGMPAKVSSDQSWRARPESPLVSQLGQRILPAGFKLEDDPTIDRLGALPLAGCYKVDEEGVPAQKVVLVEDGVLKALLMSRAPRKGFTHSNGHARQSYDGASASIANLNLSVNRGLPAKELRARLIAEAKAQKKPYALIVERLADRIVTDPEASRSEMFSYRSRGAKVLVMWKLALDGTMTRVRGGELGDIPLKSLKDIVAGGNVPAVHGWAGNGGYSITAPALLFKDIEVKKTRDPSKRPPVLARP